MAGAEKTPNWRHQILLVDREELTIDGVVSLGSYDEKEVTMDTEQGTLVIKGEDIDIKQLNLEKGNVIIEGRVKAISYDDHTHNKKGLLERLLK